MLRMEIFASFSFFPITHYETHLGVSLTSKWQYSRMGQRLCYDSTTLNTGVSHLSEFYSNWINV